MHDTIRQAYIGCIGSTANLTPHVSACGIIAVLASPTCLLASANGILGTAPPPRRAYRPPPLPLRRCIGGSHRGPFLIEHAPKQEKRHALRQAPADRNCAADGRLGQCRFHLRPYRQGCVRQKGQECQTAYNVLCIRPTTKDGSSWCEWQAEKDRYRSIGEPSSQTQCVTPATAALGINNNCPRPALP